MKGNMFLKVTFKNEEKEGNLPDDTKVILYHTASLAVFQQKMNTDALDLP